MGEDGIKTRSKWSSRAIFDSIEHPHSVLIVDQSITENPDGLMGPKSEALIASGQFLLRWSCHTADNFGNISQVKSVMRFEWGWFKISLDIGINLKGGVYNVCGHV